MLADIIFPFCSCANIAVMPHFNKTHSLQRSEMSLELIQKCLIFSRVVEENLYRHEYLPALLTCQSIIDLLRCLLYDYSAFMTINYSLVAHGFVSDVSFDLTPLPSVQQEQ